MLVGALTTAMFAGAWNVAQSQNEPTPAYPQADKHKPSTLPDRVMLTWEGDPADSQSVTWRTDATVKTAQAQIAKAGEGPDFKSAASTVLATRKETHTTNLAYDSTYHTARFTGLESKTKYLYRLGDGTNWTEWYQFQTASANPEPFSFVYYGDAQNDVQEHWSRVVRESFKDAPDTKLFLHAGDLIDSSGVGLPVGRVVPRRPLDQRHGPVVRHHRQPRVQRARRSRRSGTAPSRGRTTARRARASSTTRSRAPRSTRTSRACASSR